MKSFLKSLFARRKPILGRQVFQSRSWLQKQVDEAIYKRAFNLD